MDDRVKLEHIKKLMNKFDDEYARADDFANPSARRIAATTHFMNRLDFILVGVEVQEEVTPEESSAKEQEWFKHRDQADRRRRVRRTSFEAGWEASKTFFEGKHEDAR